MRNLQYPAALQRGFFISQLTRLDKLINIVDRSKSGQGYKKSPAVNDFLDIRKLQSVVIKSFTKYTSLLFEKSPEKYNHPGNRNIYHGARLLIKRGISEKGAAKGLIVSRYRDDDFCFTSAIHGIKLLEENDNAYLLILGILCSSFTRYYFFNTSADWGCWHHQIHLDDELLQLPVPEKLSGQIANRIVSVVKKLRDYNPQPKDLLYPKGIEQEIINATSITSLLK